MKHRKIGRLESGLRQYWQWATFAVLIVIVTSMSSLAFGQKGQQQGWDPDLVSSLRWKMATDIDPFLVSARSTCDRSSTSYKARTEFRTFEYGSPNLMHKLKVRAASQLERRNQIKKAPLAVFVGGSFGSADSQTSRSFIEWLSLEGYHVLSVPNPWAEEYVEAGPMYSLGDFYNEASVVKEVIHQHVDWLRSLNAFENEIHLLGVSHGSFISTIVATLNAESTLPLKIESVTGISPPFNLNFSMNILDRLIVATRTDYESLGLFRLLGLRAEVCRSDDDDEHSIRVLRYAPALVTWFGFQRNLSNLLNVYDETVGLYRDPVDVYRLKDRGEMKDSEFKNSLDFNNTINVFFPDVTDLLKTEAANLSYWIDRGRDHGFENFRYVTADDDFLNDVSEVFTLNADVILTRGGGHFGYRYMDWFETLIRETF